MSPEAAAKKCRRMVAAVSRWRRHLFARTAPDEPFVFSTASGWANIERSISTSTGDLIQVLHSPPRTAVKNIVTVCRLIFFSLTFCAQGEATSKVCLQSIDKVRPTIYHNVLRHHTMCKSECLAREKRSEVRVGSIPGVVRVDRFHNRGTFCTLHITLSRLC